MMCDICLCNKCKNNSETQISHVSLEEARMITEPCFNCDECYYYGMDDERLSMDVVRFKCDKFVITNYHADLEARKRRRKLEIINGK